VSVTRRGVLAGSGALMLARAVPAVARDGNPQIVIDTPMAPPRWAILQRRLLDVQAEAAQAFHDRYFDKDHRIEAFLRWGANDGPDDAIEHINDWPLLHAIGGDDRILSLYRAVQEAHFRQYSRVRTVDVPMGRKGMYVREFPPQMDWQHISEGLSSFNLMGLSTPSDAKLIERTRRFADFYTGRDPSAPNYDPKLRLIRSMFNGSLGPLMRPTTALDWAGDPFDVSRFEMEHGETSYEQTLDHYRDYSGTVGDSPLNLHATTLALNAWMLTGEDRFRAWMLDYVGAWVERAAANNDILPSNVGPDGVIGSSAGGRWWGGTYGWGFSPVVPQTGLREDRNRVPRAVVGFMNAYLATGDDRYLNVWRKQNARINDASRTLNGTLSSPTMYGAEGWYSFKAGPYRLNTGEIWYQSMRANDRDAMLETPWSRFLAGTQPEWVEHALLDDLARIHKRMAAVRADISTPDRRLADNAIDKNPVSVTALLQQTMGAIHIARPPWSSTSPNQGGAPLFVRLRHFDVDERRAGLPADVAVLVHKLEDRATGLTVINLNPVRTRTLVMRGGGYGEHRIESVRVGETVRSIGQSDVRIVLQPGCGAALDLAMSRHSLKPTLAWPTLSG
jgi:hypothetical protein